MHCRKIYCARGGISTYYCLLSLSSYHPPLKLPHLTLPPSPRILRYYGATVMQMAGFSDEAAIWLAAVPGGANFIFVVVGFLLVDRIGRRKLLIGSMCGVMLTLLLLSITFFLMYYYSPLSEPYDDQSCSYDHCGGCVGNSGCGFCVEWIEDSCEYQNGTCSPVTQLNNGSYTSKYQVDGRCALYGEVANTTSRFVELDYTPFEVVYQRMVCTRLSWQQICPPCYCGTIYIHCNLCLWIRAPTLDCQL